MVSENLISIKFEWVWLFSALLFINSSNVICMRYFNMLKLPHQALFKHLLLPFIGKSFHFLLFQLNLSLSFLLRWVRSARGRWRCSRQFLEPVVCCWWASPCRRTTGSWWRKESSCSRTRPLRSRWRCTRASGGCVLWQVSNNFKLISIYVFLLSFTCLICLFSIFLRRITGYKIVFLKWPWILSFFTYTERKKWHEKVFLGDLIVVCLKDNPTGSILHHLLKSRIRVR